MSLLCMFLFLATLNPIKYSYVEGLRTLDKNIFGPKPKGTVKTIEALEYDDIIDCVDFYKQPTFDDTLIKSSKVSNLMDPSSFVNVFNKTRSHRPKLIQTWRKYGKCPIGTVPIRRTTTLDKRNTFHRKYDDPDNHEYVTVRQRFYHGHGARAILSLWNPQVEPEEFSLSQIWISSGSGSHLNVIEAGWTVYPNLYRDKKTRLFTYWTADNYNQTGCYNTKCEGFVTTSDEITLGDELEVSVYDQDPIVLDIIIERHDPGDWYLTIHGHELGYFPASRFTSLRYGANEIEFGGEILNLKKDNHHTTTMMGSGRWPRQGLKKSSFVSNIKVKNENLDWVDPKLQILPPTNPQCYDLALGPKGTHLETHFYFGGPGYSRRCS